MTTNSKEGEKEASARRRAQRYVPNLAEFYFKPQLDWTVEEARKLYEERQAPSEQVGLDRVYYEDCIQGMRRIPDGSINLVIADPPFGIDFDGKSGAYNRDVSLVVDGYEEVSESYDEFTKSWIREIPRILRSEGSAYIFSGWTNLEPVLREVREAGLTTLNHIVWYYPFGVFTRRRFVTSHYHVIFIAKDSKNYFFNKVKHYPEDVWAVKRKYRTREVKNSTKLPTDVVMTCIDFSSGPGDVVLDPFMGNGTTAVAAKCSWRHFIGFEINHELKPVIDNELESVKLGEAYTPYQERLPTIEQLAEKYPGAYREYLRREGQQEATM